MTKRRFYLSSDLRRSLWFLVFILSNVLVLLWVSRDVIELDIEGKELPESHKILYYMALENLNGDSASHGICPIYLIFEDIKTEQPDSRKRSGR